MVNGYYDDGLGFLPAAGAGAAGGPVGIAIGLGLSAVSAIIGIFRAHKAKVQREDQVSGAWAASGPQAIEDVMTAWRECRLPGPDAIAALKQIEVQFRELTAQIVKTRGKWGVFPDPNQPRPTNECNWACGTSWELHQQINELIQEIQGRNPCETLAERAARKCANPAFVAANPDACTTGKFSQRAIAESGSSGLLESLTGGGDSSLLLIAGLAVGAYLLMDSK